MFQKGTGLGLRSALLCLLGVAALAIDHRTDRLDPVRELISQALTPIVWIAELPHTVVAIGDLAQSRGALLAQNEHLRQTLLSLQARTAKLQALEAENRRLRELLSSSEQVEDSVLVAEVLAANQDPYRHQITLNRGADDQVYRGQAIIDAHGVLGQIVRVLPDRSVGLLITDPDHGIPVEINRTGLQTVALGRGDGQSLSLPFLPGNADVKVGDLLVSSSLGGRFPPGYPVGEIAELRYQPGEHFMEAIAYPSARINQGRQVLLVWSRTVAIAGEDAGAPPAEQAGPPERPEAAPAQTAPPAATERPPS